eukprot:CAMPEP_0198207684 /NCGR_PEP_ID=MMETSP1445-20131203/11117_1 /TAXON_ID=36898 /ORGANISM="Pyramimonas sp., Strain CCMP2087" /LENGTH=131 /DNA_ID=CAMNT_0043880807 /DNA_START=270 /DNA_END=662 /DNA_ORIENTATION=-
MSGVSFALKGKRKRAQISKQAETAFTLEENVLDVEDSTNEIAEGSNQASNVDALEALRNTGSELALAGKYGQALNVWDRVLRTNPNNAVVHEQRAQVYLEIDAPWSAIQAATRATELRPGWAEALVTLGRA